MGISIDASIAFGVAYNPEEDDLDWLDALRDEDDDFDFEAIIARHAGLEPLDYSDYPEVAWNDPEREEKQNRWREKVGADAYYARKREIIAACPLDLDYAGHVENPTYVIHVRGTRLWTYWHPTPFSPSEMMVHPDDIERAIRYAAELGIPWDDPAWLFYPCYSH